MSNDQALADLPKETNRPSIYRFRLGAFEITNLLDGFNPGRATHPTFAGNLPDEMVHALAKANGVAPDKYEHVYVNTLVNTGKERVLFDTGNGKGRDVNMGDRRPDFRVPIVIPAQSGIVHCSTCLAA